MFLFIIANLNFVSNNYNSNNTLIKIKKVSNLIVKNFIRIYKYLKNISIINHTIYCINTIINSLYTIYSNICDTK